MVYNQMQTVDMQTKVKINKWLLNDTDLVLNTAMHIIIDPIDHKKRIEVYTDDGNGNGDHLFTIDLE